MKSQATNERETVRLPLQGILLSFSFWLLAVFNQCSAIYFPFRVLYLCYIYLVWGKEVFCLLLQNILVSFQHSLQDLRFGLKRPKS